MDEGDSQRRPQDSEDHDDMPIHSVLKRWRIHDSASYGGEGLYRKVLVPRKLARDDHSIGWVCALCNEMAAAEAMLDEIHETPGSSPDDSNTYTFGTIGMHNIVIACLPAAQYGKNNAATVASNMRRSFPSIRRGFMVGIGGGAPGKVDIRLGDVVVSDRVV